MSSRRLDVRSAAQTLGLSVDAVRMRVRRGSISSEKDEEGHVWVWVDTDESSPNNDETETSQSTSRELIEQLRSENSYLRGQLDQEREANRENRRLLAAAMERIPELEAADEHSYSYNASNESYEEPPQRNEQSDEGLYPTEEPAEPQTGSQRSAQKVPLWKRIFGG